MPDTPPAALQEILKESRPALTRTIRRAKNLSSSVVRSLPSVHRCFKISWSDNLGITALIFRGYRF